MLRLASIEMLGSTWINQVIYTSMDDLLSLAFSPSHDLVKGGDAVLLFVAS